jgi:protein-S-isoprenylcysteine O-methyltransferase Ste14
MKRIDNILIGTGVLGLIVICFLALNLHFFINGWFPSTFLAIAFVIACLLWIGLEVGNIIYGKANSKDVKADKVSFAVLLATELGLIIALVVSIFVSYDFKEDQYHIIVGWLQYLGTALIFIGLAFRQYAIAKLGKYFSTSVNVNNKHELLTTGIYRYIRNPSYTGTLLSIIGLPLALGAWIGAIIAGAVTLVAYTYRVKGEEKELIKRYGKKYLDYRKKTWKFFPGY